MPTGKRCDPYVGFKFTIDLNGVVEAGFRECSGLDSSQDAIEYREGRDEARPRKLPGLNKYSNITLKRGVTDSMKLWEWRDKAIKGNVERVDGSIMLVDDAGTVLTQWDFKQGWPTKWGGPPMNATANEVAIETLDIAHEGLVRVK